MQGISNASVASKKAIQGFLQKVEQENLVTISNQIHIEENQVYSSETKNRKEANAAQKFMECFSNMMTEF